ncbi:MAG: hypothetical protein AB2806_00300 [Candidatus Thiodiazotropha sp.]
MKNCFHLLFLFLISILLILGCSSEYSADEYLERESVRSPLWGALSSYMSLDEVMTELSISEEHFQVIDDGQTSVQNAPPFDVYTIRIDNYKDDFEKAKLELTFFNDRLMEIRYFPSRVEEYVRSIEGLSDGHEVLKAPFTRIWLEKNNQINGVYVGWIDTRLEKQFRAWIRDYS